tara:strand:- start:337 stop:681 length:345 start_codon:yes stop_codon:yes gene_type:complete
MEWKDILPFHKNPPNNQLYRRYDIQRAYEKDKLTENQLRKKLFYRDEVWVITKNKFPYHFVDDTQHYVIWFKNEINYNLIEFLLRDYEDVVYFENKSENKSIKSIPHVHIFLRE